MLGSIDLFKEEIENRQETLEKQHLKSVSQIVDKFSENGRIVVVSMRKVGL